MKLIIFLTLLMGNILTYANPPIIIGVLKFAPPYTSVVGNGERYYGFCIDLMDIICSRLHEACQYKATEFDKQLDDLRQGQIDLAFLPSTISPTEDKDYLYSLPYLPSTGQFMILSTANIGSVNALKEKKIGVIEASFLKKNFLSHYTTPSNVSEYANTTLLIDALTSHKVDAILLNSSAAKYLAHNVGHIRLLGEPIQFGMGYGLSALKRNAKLIERINTILLQMESDGTYEKIYTKYFGD